jgi:hypothetical protein
VRDQTGFTLWTYKSADGSKTEQVYNPIAGGIVPQFLVLQVDGVTTGILDPASAQVKGKGYTPPGGMRSVQAWVPPAPNPAVHGVQTAVGWPGMTQVS